MLTAEDRSCLYVEGLRMRPTAERVLAALHGLGAAPAYFQTGASAERIAAATQLSPHVVRARLCDLRRLGLVVSERCLRSTARGSDRVYAHRLTDEGVRRAATPANPA